jgi:hypothetical protein
MTSDRSSDVEQGILASALDYYEGWFDGEPTRMERALHPDLIKRDYDPGEQAVATMSARSMIDMTAAGRGKLRDPGDRQIRVHVDHVHGWIATVTVTSAVYVDYLQLVDVDGAWKILNVLWAPTDLTSQAQ